MRHHVDLLKADKLDFNERFEERVTQARNADGYGESISAYGVLVFIILMIDVYPALVAVLSVIDATPVWGAWTVLPPVVFILGSAYLLVPPRIIERWESRRSACAAFIFRTKTERERLSHDVDAFNAWEAELRLQHPAIIGTDACEAVVTDSLLQRNLLEARIDAYLRRFDEVIELAARVARSRSYAAKIRIALPQRGYEHTMDLSAELSVIQLDEALAEECERLSFPPDAYAHLRGQ